ncbi:Hypothetical_protein [Hexamita inflata]|uniref:Hypothetical_protein n=1 Tax=Hexamita inflata TaxID=28002 RepID=A0AA86Q9P2_9EUKA|nr:Hypothetical protein HINF_LOCUS42576 [Hexamita inflata]
MSSKDLNVIPAKVTAVESLSNDVYVSSSHDGLSIKVVHVNKSGSNTIDFDHLIKEGNSTEIQWEIQCLQNSVLSTTTVVSEPTLILTNVYVIIALENQITVFMLIITYSINSAVHFFFTSSFK